MQLHQANLKATPRRRFRTSRCIWLFVLGWTITTAAGTANAQVTDPKIRALLGEMVARNSSFDPAELDAMGLEGLVAVLDYLFPETAKPKPLDDPTAATLELIEQLGDPHFRTRETAFEKLQNMGVSAKSALLQAARHPDAEIAWRAIRLLRRWESEKTENKQKFLPGFSRYLGEIRDRPRLEELARRAKAVLESNGLGDRDKSNLARECVMAVARSNNDELIDQFKPLLEHDDVKVGVLVVSAVGLASSDHFSGLLLDALEDDREEIVIATLSCVNDETIGPQRDEVQKRLVKLFEGDNENLKFRACVPLIHVFEFDEAEEYLLAQLDDDKNRQQALLMIGDSRNHGRPASKRLLAAIRPLLQSDDYSIRRYAARALSMYSGEEVVRSLLPLLGDENAAVATETSYRLLHQTDKKMLRRILEDAVKNHESEKVREKAAVVLPRIGD